MICYLTLAVIVAAPYHHASHNSLSLSPSLSTLSFPLSYVNSFVTLSLTPYYKTLWWCSQLTHHGYRNLAFVLSFLGEEIIDIFLVWQTRHHWALACTRSVQKVSDLNFSRINKSSTGSVHHCRCGGDIYAHA